MKTYSLFGLRVAMEGLLLPWPDCSLPEAPDWTLRVLSKGPVKPDWFRKQTLVFQSPSSPAGAPDSLAFYRSRDLEVLRCGGAIDFFLVDRQILAVLDPHQVDSRHMLLLRFLGPVMAFLLERQGFPVLHASAIAWEGQAVVFMASNRGGKTGLAAGFMKAGAALLSDDLVPLVRLQGGLHMRSGFPEMRMWPDQARYFVGDAQTLHRIHPRLEKRRVSIGGSGFGHFEAGSLPVGAIYLPARSSSLDSASEVQVEQLSPLDGLMALVRHSFLPNLVLAAGWQEKRLALFARLLDQLPVSRLSYPSGFHCLDQVVQVVARDVAQRGG